MEANRDPHPRITTYIYDADSLATWDARLTASTSCTTYTYDDTGRLISRTGPDGREWRDLRGPFVEADKPSKPPYLFDEQGRLIGYIDRDGETVTFGPLG